MSKLGRAQFQPLVTIVTPSFNQGEFVADAIDSVLAQDYPRIEYMVIDGGSTDATLEVLRRYGDRVRWTSGPDAGQVDAIHRGFLAGSGEYLAQPSLGSGEAALRSRLTLAVGDSERLRRARRRGDAASDVLTDSPSGVDAVLRCRGWRPTLSTTGTTSKSSGSTCRTSRLTSCT